MRLPTMSDVLDARRLLASHLPPTPMWTYPTLNAATGATVYVKHENVQPTGAFKVRGGLTLLATLDSAERSRGVIAYSTGNHAQSLAYAAARHDTACTIVMPANPNPAKAAAVRALGADLIEFGQDLDQAGEHAELLARQRNLRLVSPASDPAIIAGVATAYVEMFEQVPDLDTVIVPAGSGSGAAAACLAGAALAPHCEIVAVQSAESPAAHDSWRAGELVDRPNRTAVEGLATGSGFALPQQILRAHLSDFLLVDDAAIGEAQWTLLTVAHTLAEGAGAAALAALLANPARFAGRTVAIMCSGGNAGVDEIRACVQASAVNHSSL